METLVEINKILKVNCVDIGKLEITVDLLDFVLHKTCNEIDN